MPQNSLNPGGGGGVLDLLFFNMSFESLGHLSTLCRLSSISCFLVKWTDFCELYRD